MTPESRASCTCDHSHQPKTSKTWAWTVKKKKTLTDTQAKCNIACVMVKIFLVQCMLPVPVPGNQQWARAAGGLWWGRRQVRLGGALRVPPHQCVAWRQGPWGAGCPAGGRWARSGNSGASMRASQLACTYWEKEGEKDVMFYLMKWWSWYFSIQLLELL